MLFRLDINEQYRNALSDDSWKVYCKADDEVELMIMDMIGESWDGSGVSASEAVKFLDANPGKPVNVRINSPGGLVYDGLTIYNALASRSEEVTATIEGLAFSAASFIAMAADTIRMYEASDIGIHRASGVAMGNQKDMRSVADWLETIDTHLIDIYSERTGADREQVETWLDGTSDGTLFSASEAVELGFADEIVAKCKKKKRNHRDEIEETKVNYRQEAVRKMIASRRRISNQLTR